MHLRPRLLERPQPRGVDVRVPDRGDRVRARAVATWASSGPSDRARRGPRRPVVLVPGVAEAVELAQQLAAPRRVDAGLVHHADQHAQVLGELPRGGIEARELAALERERARRGGRLVRRGLSSAQPKRPLQAISTRDLEPLARVRARVSGASGRLKSRPLTRPWTGSPSRQTVASELVTSSRSTRSPVPVVGHGRRQPQPPRRPQRAQRHAELRVGVLERRGLGERDPPDGAGDAHRRERARGRHGRARATRAASCRMRSEVYAASACSTRAETSLARHAPAAGLVEVRRRLPDLPAQLRRLRRRRHRRPARDHRPARLPRRARRRRGLAVADLPVAAGRQRLRHQRLPGHRPGVRHARGLRRAARRRPRARHEARHGPRRQPHLRRAPVVRRVALVARHPKRDWYWWRPPRGDPARREPNNWASFFSGSGLGARRGDRRVLPAPVLAQAARPQLGEPGGPRGRLRDDALVAGPRGRRLPHGRHQHDLQGPGAARRRPIRAGARRRRPHFMCGPRIHEFLQEMHREVFAGREARC